MSEPAVFKCMFCGKVGKPTSAPSDLMDSLMSSVVQGTAPGYTCDHCNTYICRQCYLKNGRRCFCGNSHCDTVWVRELFPEEAREYSFAQAKLTGDIVIGTLAMIGMGCACPQVNPLLPKATALTIAIITAVAIAVDGFRHKHAVSLHDKKQRMAFGSRLGATWGIGFGIMMAWGGGLVTGGVGGLGFIPWIVGGAVVYGVLTGLAVSVVSYSRR